MSVFNNENLWRDFYDPILGDINRFLFRYNGLYNKNVIFYQNDCESYLLGIYFNFLSKLDNSSIDKEELKDLLSYDFKYIDSNKITSKGLEQISKFYLDRLYNRNNNNDFIKCCDNFINNKDRFNDYISMILSDKRISRVYTNYLVNDITEQKELFVMISNRINRISNGESIGKEDYLLMIDNYKRIYLKNRIYDDVLPLTKDYSLDNESLAINLDFVLKQGDNINFDFEVNNKKENIPFVICSDYKKISNRLDTQFKMITNDKNKVLK